MKILFYGAKDYDQQFFDSSPRNIRELLLSLLKPIFMKKQPLWQKAMTESALLSMLISALL